MPTVASPAIRPFVPADKPAIVAILMSSEPWKRLGYAEAEWEQLFAPLPPGHECYVIEVDARVAGFALLRLKFLFGDYLGLFAMAEWARGRKLGARLLAHVESVVFARGTNLFVCVSDFNAGGRRFYKQQGYQEVGAINDFLIPGSAEILLRKTVGPARLRS